MNGCWFKVILNIRLISESTINIETINIMGYVVCPIYWDSQNKLQSIKHNVRFCDQYTSISLLTLQILVFFTKRMKNDEDRRSNAAKQSQRRLIISGRGFAESPQRNPKSFVIVHRPLGRHLEADHQFSAYLSQIGCIRVFLSPSFTFHSEHRQSCCKCTYSMCLLCLNSKKYIAPHHHD